jgi:hypothetical protein
MSLVSTRQACLCIAITLTLAGCGGGDGGTGPGNGPDVEGTWAGTVSAANGSSATLSISVTENNRNVAGLGWLRIATDSLGLSVSGSYTAPDIVATISSQGFEPMTLEATVSEDRMVGVLDGSGFENRAITLRRE